MNASATSATLFQKIVSASGLAALFGASTIRRACVRAGVPSPETMNGADLAKAMPALEQALRIYLPPHEVDARIRAVRGLLPP